MSERMDRTLDIIVEYAKAGKGTVSVIPSVKQQAEWSDIQKIIKDGRAKELLPAGSDIFFQLKNGQQAHVVVVALDHYRKHDAVFWFRRTVGSRPVNKTNTNEGGFAGSDLREWLNTDFFNSLPDRLQEIISQHETVQKQKLPEGDMLIRTSEDRIFLPSEYEFSGRNRYSVYNGIDQQYEFLQEERNRVAYDYAGDTMWYWTADPSSAYATYFCYFNNRGHSSIDGAHNEGGVAPLFVIS